MEENVGVGSKVYAKLMKIQTELKAPKSQFNSFGKYSYRNCEDILNGLKPLLLETKCIVNISDDIILVGDRYYVQATVKLIDTESGEYIESSAMAREEENKKGMDSSQLTGSTSSYARKYALNGLFCIDDTKDADSEDNTEHVSSPTVSTTRGSTQTNAPTTTPTRRRR